MKTLTLYTKLGCHLCEQVESVLAAAMKKHPFVLHRRDISEDTADYERYKYDVPVIIVDGVELARHRLSMDQLLKCLRS